MMSLLRSFVKILPTLGFAFVLALAVWVTAVTASDPNDERLYPRVVPVKIVGLAPDVVLIGDAPRQVTVRIRAPQSIWNRLSFEDGLVTAEADLTGLGPGVHSVDVQVEAKIRAADITSVTPPVLTLTLEPLATKTMPIELVRLGEPAIGFQQEDAELSQDLVSVSGAESQVAIVAEVRATLNLGGAHENITTTVALQPLDADENLVEGVTLDPDDVDVTQIITQRGGYRNVVVNAVTTGQIAPGYRLTNIAIFPPAIVVFSSNPQRVNDLPGYVNTRPVDLNGATDDRDVQIPLDLPPGVSVVGSQNVLVRVGIAAIESSQLVANIPVEVIGLGPGLAAEPAPATVDINISGPLPDLNNLAPTDIAVQVDLTGLGIGTHQITPTVDIRVAELQLTSIAPSTIEVTIAPAPKPTPTRRP